MRTHNRFIAAGLGLITAITLAACGTDDTAAKPGTDSGSKPAATAPKDNRPDDEPIDVESELANKDLPVFTRVMKDASYILVPFQQPLEMSKNPRPGNATCTFRMVLADHKKGTALKSIKWGSKVKITGHLVGNDAQEGAERNPGPVSVKFKDLNRNWLLETFDLRACGDLTQK